LDKNTTIYARFTPIPEMKYISTKVTEKYANISEKTIQRDIELLTDMDLIVKEKNKIRCKWEIIRSYMTRSRV
jgi:predicted HTH transcriptional regulator